MRCENFLQTVVICSEKDSSSSISRPSSLTFITLVNKLPLQVISGLLFILVESPSGLPKITVLQMFVYSFESVDDFGLLETLLASII